MVVVYQVLFITTHPFCCQTGAFDSAILGGDYLASTAKIPDIKSIHSSLYIGHGGFILILYKVGSWQSRRFFLFSARMKRGTLRLCGRGCQMAAKIRRGGGEGFPIIAPGFGVGVHMRVMLLISPPRLRPRRGKGGVARQRSNSSISIMIRWSNLVREPFFMAVQLENLQFVSVTRSVDEIASTRPHTAPPMMKIRSSSRRAHWTTLFALCASAFLLALGPATQYSSNEGVIQAREMELRLMQWCTFR